MTTKEVLTAARALIANEANFAQRHYARDANGNSASWSDAHAVGFCAVGACHKVTNRYDVDSFIADLTAAAQKVLIERDYPPASAFWPPVIIVNDLLGHEATLRMFDLAIEAAQ